MTLQRPRQPMPKFVRDALNEHELMDRYRARPPYQRNDYLGWINRAKRNETKQRRLEQMLDELADGTRYMKMPYRQRRCPRDEPRALPLESSGRGADIGEDRQAR